MTLRVTIAELVDAAERSGSPTLLAKAPGWDRVRLGDVARVVNGAAFKSRNFNVDRVGMPLIRIRDVGARGPSTWYSGDWDESHRVKRSDILVGMDGDFRAARWTSDDGLLNQRVCRIDVNDEVYDSRFLLLVVQGYLDAIWKATSSTTVKHLSSRSIADIPLPHPTLQVQRQVVDILEGHLSRLHAANLSLEISQKRLRRLRESALERCLLEASRLAGSTTSSLEELAFVGTGATPLKSKREFYANGDIPWVTSGDLKQGLISTTSGFVTQQALVQTSLKLYPPGTLLVAMYGEGKTRGTVGELAISATTNQACAAIQLEDPALQSWVRLVLDANYAAMRGLASGGVQPNLNLGLIRSILVALPLASDRARMLSWVASIESAKARLEGGLATAFSTSISLRRALLTAAFSGQLTGHASDLDRAEEVAGASA